MTTKHRIKIRKIEDIVSHFGGAIDWFLGKGNVSGFSTLFNMSGGGGGFYSMGVLSPSLSSLHAFLLSGSWRYYFGWK